MTRTAYREILKNKKTTLGLIHLSFFPAEIVGEKTIVKFSIGDTFVSGRL